MEAQISTPESEIEDVYTRRGPYYPTRSDSITSIQDRRDWIIVARHIMTSRGKKPDSIGIIAGAGARRVEIIRSFIAQKPQRSLWNILIGIFNSAKNTKSVNLTVSEMDALFEELNPPRPSPALEAYKRAHPERVSPPESPLGKKSLIELPVIPHTSRRTRGVLARSEHEDRSVVLSYSALTPKLQEVFRLFYGYVGEGDPTDPASYNGHRRSIPMIAAELGLGYQTVYARFRKISDILGGLQEEEGESPEEIQEVESVISTSQERFENIVHQPVPPAPSKNHWKSNKKQREPEFSFEELVANSPDVRTLPKKPELQIEPVVKKSLREIPQFISYREALEWGQKQADWMWNIALWRNSIPPIQRDNLAVLTFLRISENTELQNFLDTARALSGNPKLQYIKIFDALVAPLPEEKPTLGDIQKNTQWVGMIESAFQKHVSGDHAGFMDSMAAILADEALASRVFELMPEYEVEDYVDILALIVEKNWSKQDAVPYQTRTLKEVIGYKPGKYAGIDAIIAHGSHVSKKILKSGLSDVTLRVPLGQTMWPRFQEKNIPEVSLYEVAASLVAQEGGDVESSKNLFHTLQEILGLQKK